LLDTLRLDVEFLGDIVNVFLDLTLFRGHADVDGSVIINVTVVSQLIEVNCDKLLKVRIGIKV
jgi:hypothetical protein